MAAYPPNQLPSASQNGVLDRSQDIANTVNDMNKRGVDPNNHRGRAQTPEEELVKKQNERAVEKVDYDQQVAKYQRQGQDYSAQGKAQGIYDDVYGQLKDRYSQVAGAQNLQMGNTNVGPTSYAQMAERALYQNYNAQYGKAAGVGNAYQANAANIDRAGDQYWGSQQANLARLLNQTANGQGPSAASMQYQDAASRNLRQQMAMAASAQGNMSSGLAAKQALTNAAVQNQGLAQQAAIARAQEQLNAQNQLGQVLGQARGQEQGLATGQAGLEQQARLSNQQYNNQFALQDAANRQQMELANTGYANQANQFNAQQQFEASKYNTNLSAQMQMQNAQQANAMAQLQANLNQNANLANLQYGVNQNQFKDSQLAGLLGAQAGMGSNMSNLGMSWEQLKDSQFNNAMNVKEGRDAQGNQMAAQAGGGAASAALAALPFLFAPSDERVKTDIYEITPSKSLPVSNSFSPVTESDPVSRSAAIGQSAGQAALSSSSNVPKVTPPAPTPKEGKDDGKILGLDKSTAEKVSGNVASALNKGFTAPIPPTPQAGTQVINAPFVPLFPQGTDFAQVSDENKKQDIKESPNKLAELLKAAKPYEYEYTSSSYGEPGKHVSPMAQVLEKSYLGSKMVGENSQGIKYIDYGKALPAMLAGLSYVNEKVDGLRGKRNG